MKRNSRIAIGVLIVFFGFTIAGSRRLLIFGQTTKTSASTDQNAIDARKMGLLAHVELLETQFNRKIADLEKDLKAARDAAARIESGIVGSQFQTGAHTRNTIEYPVKFQSAFSKMPTVVVGLKGFDITGDGNTSRIEVRTDNITAQGFTIAIDGRGTQLSGMFASWIAYGK